MSTAEIGFELDPRLAADTVPVRELALCRVLLMDDANWPWLILVPRRPGLRELFDLERADRRQLDLELECAAGALQAGFAPDKLNIAALGNQVEQLHIHLIARHRNDPAWPQPVWGRLPRRPCDAPTRQQRAEQLARLIAERLDLA